MKKFIVVSLAVILAASLFAGCHKAKKTEQKSSNKAQIERIQKLLTSPGKSKTGFEEKYKGEAITNTPGSGEIQTEEAATPTEGAAEGAEAPPPPEPTKQPFNLTLKSNDISSGKVEGEIEWTSLGVVNRVEGTMSKGKLDFEETENVSGSGLQPGCTYSLLADDEKGEGWYKGTWDCSATTGGTGEIWLAKGDLADSADSGSGADMTVEPTETETVGTEAGDSGQNAADIFGGGGSDTSSTETAPEKPAPKEKEAPAKQKETPKETPASSGGGDSGQTIEDVFGQ